MESLKVRIVAQLNNHEAIGSYPASDELQEFSEPLPVILVDDKQQFNDSKKYSARGFLEDTGRKPSSTKNFFEASEVSDSDESDNYYSE